MTKRSSGFGVTFTIRKDGVEWRYKVTPLTPLPGIRSAWRFQKLQESGEAEGRPYDVSRLSEGTPLQCTCIGFTGYNHHTGKGCKHTRCLQRFLEGSLPESLAKKEEVAVNA